jgi:hypothetical protein
VINDQDLSPAQARLKLKAVGRFLYDAEPKTMWERDTATLPLFLRKKRKRYQRFAQHHIAPLALQADKNPESVSVRDLFLASARQGFQTELLPWPLGTMKWAALFRSFLLPAALKAEEFCTACGGLGLSLLAHELGMAPLFVCGEPKAVLKWMRRIYREIRAG